jgi:hypothetical protein
MPNKETTTPEVKVKKDVLKTSTEDTTKTDINNDTISVPVVDSKPALVKVNSAGIIIERDHVALTPYELFIEVQRYIKVNKSKYNAFAKFHFRNVEDIYEAWKKLNVPLALKLSDEVLLVDSKLVMESTAEIKDNKGALVEFAKAQAIIGEGKAGMSTEQATGSASSYARKYALNGLLLLDDNKDVDDADVTKCKGSKTKPLAESALEDEAKKIKIKELQDAIRGDKEKLAKATKALEGRSLLKLTLNEITEILNIVNSK